jgi:hypothetical protein
MSTIRWPASTTRSQWSLMVRNCLRSVNKRTYLTLMCLEGKETRIVMDQVKRSWSSFCVGIGVRTQAPSQRINYDRTFSDGSLRRIRLLTTTLHVVPIASKQQSGFSKGVSSPNGNPMVHFCGSTENVRSPGISCTKAADSHLF